MKREPAICSIINRQPNIEDELLDYSAARHVLKKKIWSLQNIKFLRLRYARINNFRRWFYTGTRVSKGNLGERIFHVHMLAIIGAIWSLLSLLSLALGSFGLTLILPEAIASLVQDIIQVLGESATSRGFIIRAFHRLDAWVKTMSRCPPPRHVLAEKYYEYSNFNW